MMTQRKSFTPEEKVSILRRHLLDKVPVSDLCDKHGLNPTVFYRWQKEMFEHAPVIFQHKNTRPRERGLEGKVAALEQKLAHKDAVIAEIVEDHIQLKKELGEL